MTPEYGVATLPPIAPFPIWPEPFAPQQDTTPTASTLHEWAAPAATPTVPKLPAVGVGVNAGKPVVSPS